MQRSYLLTVSQLRSQPIIELLHKKAIVAAIAWASLYLKLKRIECEFKERLSIQTNYSDLNSLRSFRRHIGALYLNEIETYGQSDN